MDKTYLSWQPEDDDKLVRLKEAGYTYRQLSIALERSYSSVKNRVCIINRRQKQYLDATHESPYQCGIDARRNGRPKDPPMYGGKSKYSYYAGWHDEDMRKGGTA